MTNENAYLFWERIKTLIKQNNTTQKWLSHQCGVSLNVLKSWIFNRRFPDAAQAARIAQALGTSVEYLVFGENSNRDTQELSALKKTIKDFAATL